MKHFSSFTSFNFIVLEYRANQKKHMMLIVRKKGKNKPHYNPMYILYNMLPIRFNSFGRQKHWHIVTRLT